MSFYISHFLNAFCMVKDFPVVEDHLVCNNANHHIDSWAVLGVVDLATWRCPALIKKT